MGLNGVKANEIFFSFPSSFKTVPTKTHRPLSGTERGQKDWEHRYLNYTPRLKSLSFCCVDVMADKTDSLCGTINIENSSKEDLCSPIDSTLDVGSRSVLRRQHSTGLRDLRSWARSDLRRGLKGKMYHSLGGKIRVIHDVPAPLATASMFKSFLYLQISMAWSV